MGFDELQFRVSDTGLGIKKEDQAKLFGAFEQVDGTQKINKQGSGLGLRICMQIVKKLGGEIAIESEEGQGSTFHFTIQT